MDLVKFEMPIQNSCAKCGKRIEAGGEVFAVCLDEVLAGRGICAECAESPKTATKKPKTGVR